MQPQEPQTFYFDTKQRLIQWYMNEALSKLIEQSGKAFGEIVILCIGSDRLIGDSYGPLTGHMLSGSLLPGVTICGTLDKPVHALTIKEELQKIDVKNSLVIAIDSSVGSEKNIGYVGFSDDSIQPGSGLGKNLPEIGDISISGIVAGSNAPFLNLQNASLGLVYGMAEKTAAALKYAVLKNRQTTGRIFSSRA